MLIPATIAEAGKKLFVIAQGPNRAKYFAPFAGFRRPVRTEGGVKFARPADRVGGFAIGQKVLIITVSFPADEDIAEAEAAGKPEPLPSAEEWVLFDDYTDLFGEDR